MYWVDRGCEVGFGFGVREQGLEAVGGRGGRAEEVEDGGWSGNTRRGWR